MGNTVFHAVQELARRGHEVEVFTPSYYEDKEVRPAEAPEASEHSESLQKEIATVRRLAPQLQYGNAARLSQLPRELDDFDVVHLHYPFFGTAGLVRKWKKRNPHKPLVVTYHMDARAPDWRGLAFKLYAKWYLPKVLGTADALIASSFDFIEHSEAARMYIQHPEKWVELPFGVDTDRFAPQQPSEELFATYGLDPSVETLLFVGGMDQAHYFKGIPVLLQALTIVKEQFGSEIQAVLVGDGALRTQFEQQAKAYGLTGVRFAGHVSDEQLPQMFSMADVFVLPSINQAEAFGLVLLEAMASGVPVIASSLPGVRSVAELAGMTFEPNRPEQLAAMIGGYLQMSVDERIEWKAHARVVAEEKFSWSHIVDQLETLYGQLVGVSAK